MAGLPSFLSDDETIGDFMLILRSICYTKDMNEREGIVNAIEAVLMPFTPSVSDAMGAVIQERLTIAKRVT